MQSQIEDVIESLQRQLDEARVRIIRSGDWCGICGYKGCAGCGRSQEPQTTDTEPPFTQRELAHLRRVLSDHSDTERKLLAFDWLEQQTIHVHDPVTGELLFGRTQGASPLLKYVEDTQAAMRKQEGGNA